MFQCQIRLREAFLFTENCFYPKLPFLTAKLSRTISLARSYEQGQSKDRAKTYHRQSKDRSRNVLFWNCKDVVLSFWNDLWYKGTGTGRRMGRSKTREPWIITEL